MVGAGARVIFTKFPAWIYMPCKNSVAEAVGKQALGLPLQCASAAEMAQYGGKAPQRRCSPGCQRSMLVCRCVHHSVLHLPVSWRVCLLQRQAAGCAPLALTSLTPSP
jgi:hypothetical protein